jgi:predicted HD superfamily hydrolase involved in NAD metabolism
VAACAAELAVTYGVNADMARLAGLLHDWDRDLDADALRAAAAEAGVPSSDVDEAVPYLLHARTGAAQVARTMPDVPQEVVRAIERHTVGSADMSDLDKVVYLADMIEPSRSYPGVDALREAVGSLDLGELFVRGYQQSLTHLVTARRRIHPDTVAVWNSLVAGGAR